MNNLTGIPIGAETYDVTTADSGVAWAAIIGGALAALGLTLILVPLGGGFGLAWSSPWNHTGEFGKTFTLASAIWLVVVQWLSSIFGGYLTGRLRTKWPGAHTHEVFFRDTVHGFLAWALAAVVGAVFLAAAASHGADALSRNDAPSYFGDSLFRNSTTSASITDADRAEARRILAMGVIDGNIDEADRNYLADLVSSRTALSPADANTRIDAILAKEKVAVKNAGKASLFFCLSLMVGAFIAAVAGGLGGVHRDVHYEHGRFVL